jgi:hypothetical protein
VQRETHLAVEYLPIDDLIPDEPLAPKAIEATGGFAVDLALPDEDHLPEPEPEKETP